MTINYIYAPDNSEFWRDFGLALAQRLGEQPRFWLSHESEKPHGVRELSNTQFAPFHRLNFGLVTPQDLGLNDQTVGDFAPDLDELYAVVHAFDRYDTLGRFRLVDREAVALRLFALSATLLDEMKIHALLQVDTPHWPIEIALDTVAKRKQIKRLTIKLLEPFDRWGLFAGYDGPPLFPVPRPHQFESNAVGVEQSRRIDIDETLQILLDDSAMGPGMAKQASSLGLSWKLIAYSRRLQSSVKQFLFGGVHENDLNQATAVYRMMKIQRQGDGLSTDSSRGASLLQRMQDLLLRLRRMRYQRLSMRGLSKDLKRFSSPMPSDSTPAVIFFMHFEPERTTLIEGGIPNWLQSRTLVQVRAELPPSVLLLVQEHQSHFYPSLHFGYMGRSRFLYATLGRLPGIRLLEPRTVSRNNLNECLAVVTITGTVGLEASLRGIPVYCLGEPWYRWLPGIVSRSVPDLLESTQNDRREMAIRNHRTISEFLLQAPYVAPTMRGGDRLLAVEDLLLATHREISAFK